MSSNIATPVKWFKSAPIAPLTDDSNIDRDAGIIRNVVLAQVGEAKGRDMLLDQGFIEEIVKQGNAFSNGLRSRFGHPSMSDSTMGKQLGYFRNFRVRNDQAIADLHLLNAASKSPEGDLKEWVLSMAEEAPDSVMNSIVFRIGKFYQLSEDDVIVYEGEEGYKNDETAFVELDKLLFSDLVEQGAATETLFAEGFNQDKFAVIATQFLNENPQVETFLKGNPATVYGFLKKRGIDIEKTSWFAKLQQLFSTDKPWITEIEDLQSTIQQYETTIDETNQTNKGLTETIAEQITELNERNATIQALEAEVEALKKMPVALDAATFKAKSKQLEKPKDYETINKEMADKRSF